MAKNKKSENLSTSQKVGLGVGLTAAAVTAAGAYFLYGSKNAAKNRKAVKSWALKAKAEVLEALEDTAEMTREEYETLVDTVAGTYVSFKNASKKDLKEFRDEMKDHWSQIEKSAPVKAIKKAAANATKPAPKKVTKTAPKKATKTAAKGTSKKAATKATKSA